MDIRLLIEQNNSVALTLISPQLYDLTDDKSTAHFHSEVHHDLFFIHLNEYLNTKFKSPLDNEKVSLFTLLLDLCQKYSDNEYFNRFLVEADKMKTFFFKKRFYRYYISPHEINFDLSFADLINYQANYSKHSFYHLDVMKKNLRVIFENNGIENFELEDYNEHFSYFKEHVLDDRLNFNTTMFLEVLGDFFMSYNQLINSPDNIRVKQAYHKFFYDIEIATDIGKPLREVKIEMPDNMTDIELFHWEIKSVFGFDQQRIENFTPDTCKYLVESETSEENRIIKI